MNGPTRPAASRWEPRRSTSRRPTPRAGARLPRKRHGRTALWLLVLLLLAGGGLLWQQAPALRQAVPGCLAFVHHAGWWLLGVLVLLGVGLASGGWWLWRGLGKAARRRARARGVRLRLLHEMDPLAFEHYVGQVFEGAGYRVAYTPHSGDEGIDLWLERAPRTGWQARLSPLKALVGGGTAGRIPVQCKRYGAGHAVGSPELQRFSGAMRRSRAETGIVVTTSRFTKAARTWARNEGISLVDGAALARWQARVLPTEPSLLGPGPLRDESASAEQKGRIL